MRCAAAAAAAGDGSAACACSVALAAGIIGCRRRAVWVVRMHPCKKCIDWYACNISALIASIWAVHPSSIQVLSAGVQGIIATVVIL